MTSDEIFFRQYRKYADRDQPHDVVSRQFQIVRALEYRHGSRSKPGFHVRPIQGIRLLRSQSDVLQTEHQQTREGFATAHGCLALFGLRGAIRFAFRGSLVRGNRVAAASVRLFFFFQEQCDVFSRFHLA